MSQSTAPANYYVDLPFPCSPCGCCESAVGLAYLEIDCAENTVTIDESKCRRYVMSPGLLRWILSKIPPKYKSDEILKLYPRLMDEPIANLVSAVDEFTKNGEYVRTLRKEVEDLDKRVRKLESRKAPATPKGP